VNAYQIHEWLHDTVLIREDDVRVIQIDGTLRKIYVKFVSPHKMANRLQQSQGELRFYHENGDISSVKVEITGVGIRRVRVSTLPQEVTEAQIKNALAQYGDIKQIHDDVWSQAYRFKEKTGVRLVDISMTKHIPSHIKIEGRRALIAYEGQPMTCFRCNKQGHQQVECPRKQTPVNYQTNHRTVTWANIVKSANTEVLPTTNPPTSGIPAPSVTKTITDTAQETLPHDKGGHPKQQKPAFQDENPHQCPSEPETMTHDTETDRTEITIREDDEQNSETQALPATCFSAMNWIDLIQTEKEQERTDDKQGKKREQSKLTSDTNNDGIEVDENMEEATSYQQTQTVSPKRPKKNKSRQGPQIIP